MDFENEGSVGLEPLEKILASRPEAGAGDLIPILQKIQETYGYLY
jgi:hypothetical protein